MDWKLILQLAGIALGLLYLWLEYRADIWLWVVGLIMPVVHGVLYYRSGLYADCSMQVYYVLAGLYGWVVWQRSRRQKNPTAQTTGTSFAIARTPLRQVPLLVGAYALVHVGIYWVLVRFTNSTVPFWDSFTTALSVVAMWMLSRKYAEQWLVWLVVDLTTVGLYCYKEIPFTAGLYLLYSALSVAGYLRWNRQIRNA
ncbi:MAG: nicotinamide riboside transporter PnuC [Alistipes sp.]|nr:nicotinamide riboside transporter PnuC [Alistipes sp.]